MRTLTTSDLWLEEAQQCLRTVFGGHRPQRSLDSVCAADHGDRQTVDSRSCQPPLARKSPPIREKKPPNSKRLKLRRRSANLLRVNHSGEVAAQALYRGQALSTQDPVIAAALRRAADEEIDHLIWCQQRLTELDDRSSYLVPVWYSASLLIGVVIGELAIARGLGFVEETEIQVTAHLDSHLLRLPTEDKRSARMLAVMREDELRHAHWAKENHAIRPGKFGRQLMTCCARIMTSTSYYF